MALFRKPAPVPPTPLDGVDLVLADLDGVVYRGAEALPQAVEGIRRAQETRRVAYITNNAARTPAHVAAQLVGFGLDAVADDVVTSPQAAVALLREILPTGATVFVVGGEGLTSEVERAGFIVTRSAEDSPAAVVQGFHPDIGWTDLAEAAFALAAPPGADEGIPWVATNTDWTIPLERGLAPGNGSLVSAVHLAVGRLPVFAGKPERAIFDTAVARYGQGSALMIGDRLDTDILGANRAGIPAALVLTGVDGARQLLPAAPDQRPRFILEDLRGLHEPYRLPVESRGRDGRRLFQVGDAVVSYSDYKVVVEVEGDSEVELLRAGCAAVWESGIGIYALDVDERLHARR